MIKVYPDVGGWRVDVFLRGRLYRTAWRTTKPEAMDAARAFAEHYAPNRHDPLPIKEVLVLDTKDEEKP
ncbi:MAG TPA: hypothetical protein VKD90_30230 [Gemmataceae bacterium]|nr:hypothetical protein [Gemmataceae bacterium]